MVSTPNLGWECTTLDPEIPAGLTESQFVLHCVSIYDRVINSARLGSAGAYGSRISSFAFAKKRESYSSSSGWDSYGSHVLIPRITFLNSTAIRVIKISENLMAAEIYRYSEKLDFLCGVFEGEDRSIRIC
ncbi:MAG: hypothetical protein ACREBS_00215 [Nitrososphaerales archaeon]